jgi:uncharacterized protein DUF2721
MMQYTTLSSNPFGVLTSVVAPAILTNACSVLALGTSNRLARVVDRTRVVAGELAGFDPVSSNYKDSFAQLDRLQVRAQLLLKALRVFYASIGLFAAAALVSVIGALTTYYGQRILFELSAAVALVTGLLAVVGLASGCVLMVRETKSAVRNLAEEARLRSRR